MRIYTKRNGNHQGQHLIFDTIDEAIEELSGDSKDLNVNKQDLTLPKRNVFQPWYAGNQMDWVMSDDGRIVQILELNFLYKYRKDGSRTTFRNGRPYYTAYFKTCFGTYSYFTLKDGSFKVYHTMNADVNLVMDIAVHNGSLSKSFEHRPFGKYLTNDKKMFVYWLWRSGFDPVVAYIKAYKGTINWKNKPYVVDKALQLCQDPYVIEELKYYMQKDKTFVEKLKDAFHNEDLNPDRFARELNEGIKACTETIKIDEKLPTGEVVQRELPNKKKGGMAHLAWVRTLGQALASVEEKPGTGTELLTQDTGAVPFSIPSAPENSLVKVEASFKKMD